jgi:hypothetical protein
MNLKETRHILNLALTSSKGDGINYVTEAANLDETIVKITIPDAKGEEAFASRVLESLGFVPVPALLRRSEIASHGGLEYTNDPEVIDSQYDGPADVEQAAALDDTDNGAVDDSNAVDIDDNTGDNEDDDAPEPVEDDTETAISIDAKGNLHINASGGIVLRATKKNIKVRAREVATPTSLDTVSDDSKLKVLGNPEMMKFANKVFDMVSPGEDKSNYAAFLYNFDDFLLMHQPDSSYTETDEPDDGDDEDLGGSSISEMAKMRFGEFIKAFPGDIETAAAHFINYDGRLPLELARGKKKKGKNGRSAFLSVLMKGMSGDAGNDAIMAYGSGDKDKLKTALSHVVDKIVSTVSGKSDS